MRGGELGLVRVSNKCQMQSMPFRAGFACWPVFIDKILWTTTIKKHLLNYLAVQSPGTKRCLERWITGC
ncbi:hypothetical protein BOM23_13700 [Erwinia sp. OLMDLW33]|nr:hypothetical protein BOM23_13700 [Erwinia sp. OLMDLW33]